MSTVSSVASTASTATTSSASSTLSTDAFLQLLMTQLENQNPLDPMDPTEFTKQLVSYSSLEQQIQSNAKLDTLSSQLTSLSAASMVSYLGTTAELNSDIAPYQSGKAEWSYTLPEDASSVAITVKDSDGNTVYSGSGDTSSGEHKFSLSSSDLKTSVSDGEALTITVTAKNSAGETLDPTITSFATIDGFDVDASTTAYQAGSIQFSSDYILRLQSSTAN